MTMEENIRDVLGRYNVANTPVEDIVAAVVFALNEFRQWTSEYGCPWEDGYCPRLNELKEEYIEDSRDPDMEHFDPREICCGDDREGACYVDYYLQKYYNRDTPKPICENR